MPTPDPSASLGPWHAYVVSLVTYADGRLGDALDLTRLLIFAVCLLGGLIVACSVALVVSSARR